MSYLTAQFQDIHPRQYHICQSAVRLFSEKNYEDVTMAEIAVSAGLGEAELYTCFGTKTDIILFLYQSINTDWQMYVSQMPAKKLADRFEMALKVKMELMQPYEAVLGNMMGLLLNNPKIGVQSPRTSHIRAMGLQTMQSIVSGATDSARLVKRIGNLPPVLYMMHWAALFLYMQSHDKEKDMATVKLMAGMLRQANNLSFLLKFIPFFNEISEWSVAMLGDKNEIHDQPAREIVKIIFNNRKTTEATPSCLDNSCETCMEMHLARVQYFTGQNLPLHFILPAFPAKSPNLSKVLGTLPDLGEEIALTTLNDLCREIKSVYGPGATITICSDGRIFSELVGVNDAEISKYVSGIKQIIGTRELHHIEIVNLEDLLQGDSFDALRKQVLDTYAEPLDDLYEKLKYNQDFKNLFNGIHRFISDDIRVLQPGKSVTKVKEEAKPIALKVIQHSNAWTRFLAYIYPDSIRLSIHPYPAHSDKTGIKLTRAADNWLTPWHGVIVLGEDGYVLMKKNEAEEKGARLVYQEQRPYYYTLIPE